MSSWTFLTTHGLVLLHLLSHPNETLRGLARVTGVTERTAARVVRELKEAGYLLVHKQGRRNKYQINTALPLRHPVYQQHTVRDLFLMLAQIPTAMLEP